MTRLLLTVPEAAEALAISRSKLYELLASGAVASIRIDGSRRIPEGASDVGAALGNRTPDLRITSRIRGVQPRPGSAISPAHPGPYTIAVHDHPGS
jgi:excisionase family DNA binding protein